MVSLCKSHKFYIGTNVVIVFQIWDLSASSRQTWKLCLKHLDQKLYCDNFALETFIHTENYNFTLNRSSHLSLLNGKNNNGFTK